MGNNAVKLLGIKQLAILLAAFLPFSSAAAEIFQMPSGGFATIELENFTERKNSRVTHQQYDFSCGSAAVATLLTYHYARPTTEVDAFKAMWAVGDQERIRSVGFSLLEIKAYLESLGYVADGFKLSGLKRVADIGVPGIALIDTKGYKHFVVIKGITDKTVLFGDPSAGLVSMPRKEFAKMWDGVILFVRSNVHLGKENFNSTKDWRRAPSPPFDRASQHEPLSHSLLWQTRPNNSGTVIHDFDAF